MIDLWDLDPTELLDELEPTEKLALPNSGLILPSYFDAAGDEQLEFDFDTEDFGKQFSEKRVFGPPGCGKTFYASKLVKGYTKRHPKAIFFITSLTRTGAAAARGNIEVTKNSFVGTLHAACYKLYGRPKLAELKIDEFNAKFPRFALKSNRYNTDGMYPGEKYRHIYQIYRSKLIPSSEWSGLIKPFVDSYEGWKTENEYMDYVDLLYRAYLNADRDPFNADFMLGDEAQDWSFLGFQLMRKWGAQVKEFWLIGDPDQAIFAFNGASPQTFQAVPIPPQNTTQLNQSYRCPASVLRVALPWIEQITDRVRQVYKPRQNNYHKGGVPIEGFVRRSPANFKEPSRIVGETWDYIKEGKSVMICAPCGYMLKPTIEVMRNRVLPFSNPFAPEQVAWSPLQTGKRDKTTSTDRVVAFIKGSQETMGAAYLPPTGNEMALWVEYCQAQGVALPKMKGKIEDLRGSKAELSFEKSSRLSRAAMALGEDTLGEYNVYKFLTPEAVTAWETCDLKWLREHVMSSKEPMLYPIDVALAHGERVLRERHKLWIGTIHSFKGHEADVVYIIPDLSNKFWEGWTQNRDEKDALIRLGYVALTRAREGVVVLTPATSKAFNFPLNKARPLAEASSF